MFNDRPAGATQTCFERFTKERVLDTLRDIDARVRKGGLEALDASDPLVGIGVEPGEGIYARSGLFGYWLGEPNWGRGIMTAAARACADHVLASLEVVRLEAPVFEWNPASMRVLEKCGFVREGVLRRGAFKDGQLIDVVLYARVR